MASCRVGTEMLWLVTLLLLLSVCPSHALNLDDRSPTIVRSGVEAMEDGFGWAIAQHELTNGTNILLVSAPKGNGTYSSDEGVIYVCPFNIREGCKPNYDFGLNDASFLLTFASDPVNIRGQLLGYSLKSFSDHVVATAPYQRQSKYNAARSTWKLNGHFVSLDGALNQTSFLNFYGFFNQPFSFDVIGIDAALIKRDDKDYVLVNNFYDGISTSVPGTVFQIEIKDDPSQNPLKKADTTDPGLQEYRGYHLETGYFTSAAGSDNTQMVMSAPRGQNHLGYVEVVKTDLTRPPIVRIVGQEVDGYFGYDVAVTNFGQTDGYQSLVISCPLCRTDSGRVYVYVHTGNPSAPFAATATQVINSPSTSRGRFGIGVEAIGDVDLDGFTDVAISAPYLDDGVVYVYRGSASGLVTDLYQTITPQYPATAFGYSLSGGLDIDGNGYPDLTVGDLGSRNISTIRGSPLVNVTTLLLGTTVLDIFSSRPCADGDVMLHCFNVTPCFYYHTTVGQVSRFALKYNLSADITLRRVGVWEDGVATAADSIVSSITIQGPGEENKACGDAVTFALYENLLDPADILVSIMVEDADDPLALEEEPSLAMFGKPLHPTLLKYSSGDKLARTSFDYPITFNINCSSGNASICEGILVSNGVLNLAETEKVNETDKIRVIVSPNNEFSVDVTVTNDGMDTSLGSVFDIVVPDQIEVSAATTTCKARVDNGTLIECPLNEAIAVGGKSTLSISFTFNDTSAFVGEESFNISLSARDGGTSEVFSRQVLTILLDSLGEYQLVTSVAQAEYSSFRSVRSFTDTSGISLDRLGPLVTYTALVQNNISGTAFSRSTLRLYVPIELKSEERFVPLLIPSSVVVGTGVDSVNCSHYQSFSDLLLLNQRPQDYIPSWTGTPPPGNPECEKNGMFRCGVIICTVFNLQPLPKPPLQINVFARLYSPAVDDSTEVTIYATITKDTVQPRLSPNSVNSTSTRFSVVPGPRDVARQCIRYWVVVLSVVIGIFVLLALIVVLMLCAAFWRWYKSCQRDMLGDEQIDSEISYHRRTIPPISGMSNGTSPPPEANNQTVEQRGGVSMSDMEREKDEEAQRELDDLFAAGGEMEERRHSRKSTSSTASVAFDPSKGLEYGGGEETEI